MNITYNCPYNSWEWANSQVKLSGNYAYPIVLTYPFKSCSEFTIKAFLYADTTVPFNRSWTVYIYTGSSWLSAATFTMPAYSDSGGNSDGKYMASCSVNVTLSTKRDIQQIVAVPSSTINRAYTWRQNYSFSTGATVTESFDAVEATDSGYFCGLYTKRSSLYTTPARVFVNIGGILTEATAVMASIAGNLISIPKMKQYAFTPANKQDRVLIAYTAESDGTHTIDAAEQYNGSTSTGYVDLLIFDSDMKQLYDYTQSEATVSMQKGSTYYILAIDSPNSDECASKLIKIYS